MWSVRWTLYQVILGVGSSSLSFRSVQDDTVSFKRCWCAFNTGITFISPFRLSPYTHTQYLSSIGIHIFLCEQIMSVWFLDNQSIPINASKLWRSIGTKSTRNWWSSNTNSQFQYTLSTNKVTPLAMSIDRGLQSITGTVFKYWAKARKTNEFVAPEWIKIRARWVLTRKIPVTKSVSLRVSLAVICNARA